MVDIESMIKALRLAWPLMITLAHGKIIQNIY